MAGERAAAPGLRRSAAGAWRLAVAGDGASALSPLWTAAPGGGGLAAELEHGEWRGQRRAGAGGAGRGRARCGAGAWRGGVAARYQDGRQESEAVAGARVGAGRDDGPLVGCDFRPDRAAAQAASGGDPSCLSCVLARIMYQIRNSPT
jgi:hypothetical protein